MKFRLIASAAVVLALALNACSSAAIAVPASAPAPTPIAAAVTAVPASPTAVPASPTAVPTIAPSPTSVTPPTAAPTNTAAVAQPAASGAGALTGNMTQMTTAMVAATSYRITINSVNSATGQSTTAVMEVVKPDRLHLKANLAGGKTYEMIAIGQDAYINATGTWMKSPVAIPTSAIVGIDPQGIPGQITASQKAGTLTKGGTSQVNGAPCQLYTWTPAAGANAGNQGGTACIDLKSGLLVQVKSTDGKTTSTFSDWNTAISIVAPM